MSTNFHKSNEITTSIFYSVTTMYILIQGFAKEYVNFWCSYTTKITESYHRYPSSIKAPQDLAKNIFFSTPEKAPSEFIMILGLFWAWSAPSNYSDIRVTLIRVTTKGRPNCQGWNRKLLWWKWSWNTLYKTIMKFQHGVNAATRLWHLAAVITTEGTLTAHVYFITVPQSTYDSWICMVIGMYTPWGFRTHHLRFCFLGLLG